MKTHTVGAEVLHADRWIDRQMGKSTDTGRQAGGRVGWRVGRQTDRQAGRQTDRQTGRQADTGRTDMEKGALTKAFFPLVRNRIRQKIPVFPELTTMLTGHGKIRSYLYRFGLTDTAMCPCEEEEETVDHLIFKCKKLNKNRNEMIKQIKNNGGNWPTSNETLFNKYLKFFVKFVKSIDFRDLQ